MESLRPSHESRAPGGVARAIAFASAMMLGLALRLGTWPQVFLGGRVWIDGPDGYYHLRRAWLTLRNWPWTPQVDMLIGVPDGGPISWPPIFDLLLATLALPWPGEKEAVLELVGAALPPLLGVIEIAGLYWLLKRLFSARAAAWAAGFAAVLPGVSRYSLLGALDHDPLVEIFTLLALAGIALDLERRGGQKAGRAAIAVVGCGVALLVLTWAGAILHLGLLCLVVVAVELTPVSDGRRLRLAAPGPAFAAAIGFLVAAVVTLPFVLGSVWTARMGATFIGLSWLHTAVLLGVGIVSLGVVIIKRFLTSKDRGGDGDSSGDSAEGRWAVGLACVATMLLLVLSAAALPAFRQGLTFLSRGEPFLQGVMESRPLLSLFGTLDFRAAVVRLSLLPFLAPLAMPWMIRRTGGDRRVVLLWSWFLYTLILALVQSRYAHAAALPIAALAGVAASNVLGLWSQRRHRWVRVAVVGLLLVPSLPAYLPIAGFESYRFYGRAPRLLTSGMGEVCDFLRREEPSLAWEDPDRPSETSVQAPWSFGHWLMWLGRQGTVATPLGPFGQPAFADGMKYYFLELEEAREIIRRRRVRYIIATAEVPQFDAWSELAGVDARRFFSPEVVGGRPTLRAERYLPTLAARLSWIGTGEIELFGTRYAALEGLDEVFRSSGSRRNPFAGLPALSAVAEVPMVRVYRVREGW